MHAGRFEKLLASYGELVRALGVVHINSLGTGREAGQRGHTTCTLARAVTAERSLTMAAAEAGTSERRVRALQMNIMKAHAARAPSQAPRDWLSAIPPAMETDATRASFRRRGGVTGHSSMAIETGRMVDK